jgi:serine/threonine protein kinase/Tol biopolymer transport system component
MGLNPGTRLGSYEITALLGVGGMGEVYRARDTKLDREVAIKLLPASVADSPERLSRFEQEARSAGSLNHPNLITVHELGTHDGSPYIVMELIEGETLRQKLGNPAGTSSAASGATADRGSATSVGSGRLLPLRKTIDYAVQLAHGLAAAHDKGITHRDLKPENILIGRDGRVRILDFGLAKLTGPAADGATVAAPRTHDTEPGTVMGTAGYMSPEQVRGEAVDHRSDIFSLGVILYEMLSGRRAFSGDTAVQTMNAILTEDPPDLAGDGSRVSGPLERVIRRCLEKEKEERFQSSHDLAFALEAVGGPSAAFPKIAVAGRTRRRRLLAALGILAFGAISFVVGRGFAPSSTKSDGGAPVSRLPQLVPLTFEQGEEIQPSLSPDGRSFVFVSRASGNLDIYFQRVGGENTLNLTADSKAADFQPAFSPDGERIAFRSTRDGGGIYVMGATGESVRRLTDFGFNPAWSPDGKELAVAGESVFNPFGRSTVSHLWRVDVATGDTTLVTRGDAVQPQWSPGGRWIAYWGLPKGTGKRTLYTIAARGGDPHPLTDDDSFNWNPVWSNDERSLYFSSTRGGTMDLWRMPMDPSTGAAIGDPEPLTVSSEQSGWLTASRDGSRIAFTSGRSTWTLTKASTDSKTLRMTGTSKVLLRTSRPLTLEDISPDGELLVMRVSDPNEDIMVCRTDGTGMRRITNDRFKDRNPKWSWDGQTIWFFSDRSGRYEIWSIKPDGSGLTQITETSGENVHEPIPSPDGALIAVRSLSGKSNSGLIDLRKGIPVHDVAWFPPIDSTRTFMATAFAADGKRILGHGAPGGDLFIYSLDTGTYRGYPGARDGTWAPDGRSIFYARSDTLFSVDTESGDIRRLFELPEENRIGSLLTSRDFRSLYRLASDTESDVWMLDYGNNK